MSSTSPKFPISHGLGFESELKTHLRPQIKGRLRDLLFLHVPLPSTHMILPANYGGHRLTRPQLNIGHTFPHLLGQYFQYVCPSRLLLSPTFIKLSQCPAGTHPRCGRRYHAITAVPDKILERVPELTRLLAALKEVSPTPRSTPSRPRPTSQNSSTSSSSSSGPTPNRGRLVSRTYPSPQLSSPSPLGPGPIRRRTRTRFSSPLIGRSSGSAAITSVQSSEIEAAVPPSVLSYYYHRTCANVFSDISKFKVVLYSCPSLPGPRLGPSLERCRNYRHRYTILHSICMRRVLRLF